MKRMLPMLGLALVVSACGSNSSQSTPTAPTTTPTKIISVSGNMDFGQIQVGSSFTATLHIANTGNTALTVSSIALTPAALTSTYKASWTSGTISAGGFQDVVIQFSPTAAQSYTGTLLVNADQTSGTTSIAITGTGTLNGLSIFTKSGSGNTVFDMPTYVTRIHITGKYTGFSSNFIVMIGGQLVVNDLVGTAWTSTVSDGTYLTIGGTVAITNSQGVAWTFTEVR